MTSSGKIARFADVESETSSGDRTRDKLLRAGITVFAELGYHAASTRLIEGAAGVKRNLISYHWGSKEEFWRACFSRLADDALREIRLAEQQAVNVDGVERLRYFIRAFVRLSAKFPELQCIMLDEGRRAEDRLQWIVKRHVKPFYARVEALLNDARRIGAAISMDTQSFYYALVGSAVIFTMAPECRLLSGEDPQEEAMIARHADAIARLLIRDDGPRPETRKRGKR